MASIRFRTNRWQAQVRRKGAPAITRSFLVKRDAETWARQVEAAIERGDDHPECSSQKTRLTLRHIVERYRDTISIRKKGHQVEKIVLNAFLRRKICDRFADSITAADMAQYRDERLETVTANTLRREFSTLHHLFETARTEWGLILKTNPLDKVKAGQASPHRERRLLPGEEQRLLESARACRNPKIRCIIELALQTGMRRGELLGIKWTDIEWQNRSLIVRDPKNGSPRHIPLSRSALQVLRQVEPEGERVFPLSANAFRLTWERLRNRASLSDLHFHDLRHEAVSRFFEMGLTAPEVASISGHKDPRMLFRYAHPIRSRILGVMDRQQAEAE